MKVKIPTNCKKLDEILNGGFAHGEISLVYGEAETAKTTLALQCSVNCAEYGFKTLFIDCDNTFPAKRLAQIASDNFKKVAEFIILTKPKDFKEQTLVIEELANYLSKDFGLVIIDTVTSLYRVELAENPENKFKLNRELNRQLAMLAQIARTHKITVLITSHVRSVFDETYTNTEPVATRVVKFWADKIIAMKPTENPKVIKAVLEKDTKMLEPLFCYLEIGEKGLKEYVIH